MKYLSTVLSTSALLASTVSAHGGVTSYSIGGTKIAGWEPYIGGSQKTIERQYASFDPLLKADLSTVKIRCNNNGILGTGVSATIAAGSSITAYWPQWTHAEGCVMVYMAKCPSSGCNSFDGSGSVWFKIDQVGLVSGTVYKGKWGSGLVMDTLKWEVTIPAALPSGEYLIRHELLALHQANTPQFYPECAQLTVTGGGSGTPGPLVSFPGAYSASDPSVDVNIYSTDAQTQTSYTCPGPAVWGGSGGGSNPPVSSATTTLRTSTTTRPAGTTTTTRATTTAVTTTRSTTTSAAPQTTGGSGTAPLYGQCGGIGWNGATTCASGTCKASGAYYSQCLP